MPEKTVELMSIRSLSYSGQAYRTTVPEKIISFWNLTGNLTKEKDFPLAFFKSQNTIEIEPLFIAIKNPKLSKDTIKIIQKEYAKLYFKRSMYKQKILRDKFIKDDKWDEKYYNQELAKHMKEYFKVLKKLKGTLNDRGLSFIQIDTADDLLDYEFFVLEKEKDEKMNNILSEIELIKKEKEKLEKLFLETKQKKVSKKFEKTWELIQNSVETELASVTKRFQIIKNCVKDL